jgi:nucleoside-diphosphate-sugar epimerase
MSILVTGASGFVGAHIIDTLLASGKEVILAADLESAPSPVEDRRVQHLALDVTDAGAVRRLIGSMRPEAVVHAAAVTPSLEEEATQADRIVAVNAGGSANVAAAALPYGGVCTSVSYRAALRGRAV